MTPLLHTAGHTCLLLWANDLEKVRLLASPEKSVHLVAALGSSFLSCSSLSYVMQSIDLFLHPILFHLGQVATPLLSALMGRAVPT